LKQCRDSSFIFYTPHRDTSWQAIQLH
jgi:hypothetical protein